MELYKEVLVHAFTHGDIQTNFSCQETDITKIIE